MSMQPSAGPLTCGVLENCSGCSKRSSTVTLRSAGQGVEESWGLEGVDAPHDLAVVAAPVRLAGADRPLALLVGETRPSGSRLHKFILVPAGALLHPLRL